VPQPRPQQRAAPARQALAASFRAGAPPPGCAQASAVPSEATPPAAVVAKQTDQEENEEQVAGAEAAGARGRRTGAAAAVEGQLRNSREAARAAADARHDAFPNERRGGHLGELGLRIGRRS
jgi:hypothetical protein